MDQMTTARKAALMKGEIGRPSPPTQKGKPMTSHHHHAVIWIDHREARVFHFNPTDIERLVVHPEHPTKHIHHKANCIGSGHAAEDHEYLQAVAQSVADAGTVLITGPCQRKDRTGQAYS